MYNDANSTGAAGVAALCLLTKGARRQGLLFCELIPRPRVPEARSSGGSMAVGAAWYSREKFFQSRICCDIILQKVFLKKRLISLYQYVIKKLRESLIKNSFIGFS